MWGTRAKALPTLTRSNYSERMGLPTIGAGAEDGPPRRHSVQETEPRRRVNDQSSNPTFDVAVVGGGPAGAVAGRLLAQWGHSVVILNRPGSQSSLLGESLPPSTRKILDRVGALKAMESAGFVRSTGHTVWWGESDGRVEEFPEGETGFQVRRTDLDRVLLALAEEAGARLVPNATVRDVESDGDLNRVEYRLGSGAEGDSTHVARAHWVLDCSGRSGVVARNFRRPEEGQATLALLGIWRSPNGWTIPDETHTLVESFADGWAWSVPIDQEVRYFTTMVDPRVSEMERSKDLGSIYRAEMAKTRRMEGLLTGAAMEGAAWACNASMYSASRYAEGRTLLVGDAATFLDPVSSFGVKKALASAWRAAVVVHTALTKPEMERAAVNLHEGRERRTYASYRNQAAEVFRSASEEHAFWERRGREYEDSDAFDEDGEPDIEQLRNDPKVLTAFDALRRSPSIDLVRGDDLSVVHRPVIVDNEVVLEDRLASPRVPSGLRYLRGVDVQRLLQISSDHVQVPDLFEAYCRLDKPVILPDFMGALSVLLSHGILVNRAPRG